MRALSYEQVMDIRDLIEDELRRIAERSTNEREVFARMQREGEPETNTREQKKIQRLMDVLNIFGEELSVVNFSFGFGGKKEEEAKGTGLIYGVSAGENDTENN